MIHFGRMLDKVRLNARGALPADYIANLGDGRPQQFDARCCRFLGVDYAAVRARVLQGGCDEEILAWAHANGAARSDEECVVWNRFISKLGWRDDRSDTLRARAAEYGLLGPPPETFCELIDMDEGRPAGATRSWEPPALSAIILMGVSGCGKTTVGLALAAATGWQFLDSDALHPASNIAKMSAGNALDDSDRAPWLAAIRADIDSRVARGAGTVVACSALREAYRAAIAPEPARRRFVHLRGDYALIAARMGGRSGHFMKEPLLRSQFDALEEPADALTLDASQAPGVLVDRIRNVLGLP